jgi:HD-like signal output (HDOD) protein
MSGFSHMQIRKPLFEKIATLKNLPTLPHILLKLIDACNQESSSLKDVSTIVEKDPSLSSKILRLVNSAHYGLPHRVENMDQAVALIGIKAVKNIAICASVYGSFSQSKRESSFNLKLFWWHSLKCAVLARLIAKKTRYSEPDEAFLSGLLHDIGKLVLWVNFPEQYTALLEEHKDQPERLLADEIRLGGSHCEVGAWLLNRWKLPSFMVDSVLYHHEPRHRILNALSLAQIVYVANILCREPVHEQEEGSKIAEEILGGVKRCGAVVRHRN